MQKNPFYESGLNSSSSDRIVISGTYTPSNPYVALTDGYVWIYMTNQNSLYSVSLISKNDTTVTCLRGQASVGYEYHSLYVKKGMKIACNPEQSTSEGDVVWFYPLTD